MVDVQKFLTDISSPYWWISIVVVGILVSVFSNGIYKLLEKLLIKFIKSYRLKSAQKKLKALLEEDELARKLINDHDYFVWYQINTPNYLTCAVIAISVSAIIMGSQFGRLTEINPFLDIKSFLYYFGFAIMVSVWIIGGIQIAKIYFNRANLIRKIIKQQSKTDDPSAGL
jgi:hypothetical protein